MSLPKSYMLKSHAERAEIHMTIVEAIEHASATSLPNIKNQTENVEAKRKIIGELIVAMENGFDLYDAMVQIDVTMSNDAKYEE